LASVQSDLHAFTDPVGLGLCANKIVDGKVQRVVVLRGLE
jgi:hypothetical protein